MQGKARQGEHPRQQRYEGSKCVNYHLNLQENEAHLFLSGEVSVLVAVASDFGCCVVTLLTPLLPHQGSNHRAVTCK